MHGCRTRLRSFAASGVAVVAVVGVSGCSGGGTKFSIGDCISVQTNNRGGAVRADECSSRGALKIEKLATGGQRPDCGTGMQMEKGTLASYVHDLQTDITYCGF
jgi:hypothetical protein